MNDECLFKQYQRVIFEVPDPSVYSGIFKQGEVMLFLGEIVDMPGHCIIVNEKGKVFWGYHTENFRALTEDEA